MQSNAEEVGAGSAVDGVEGVDTVVAEDGLAGVVEVVDDEVGDFGAGGGEGELEWGVGG